MSKMVPISKAFFGAEDNPDFNLPAAVETYKWCMSEDGSEFVLNSIMSGIVEKCMDAVGDEINEEIHKGISARYETLKKSLASGIINKSMSDEAVEAAISAIEQISKGTNDYTSWERSQNVNRQRRGPGGRFTPMGQTKMNLDNAPAASPNHPSYNQGGTRGRAQQLGLQATPNGVNNLGQYQAAYDEVIQAIDQLGIGQDNPATAEVRSSEGGKSVTRRVAVQSKEDVQNMFNPLDFAGQNKVEDVTWYAPGQVSPGSQGYVDPVAAAGSGLINYEQRAIQNGVMPGESGATRGMRHISNVAETADESGLGIGFKSKTAIAAGKMIGDFGPEAERIFGPAIRRASYRYRGTERDIDPEMVMSMNSSIAGSQSKDEARHKMMVPLVTSQNDRAGTSEASVKDPGSIVTDSYKVSKPSPFMRYWQSRLPDANLLALHTQSGSIAPSEGVIISRKGQPVSQAVGYGDDHYLPFNLKKMGKMKGGEYVRTRTAGGLTSEDLYAGVMSGTRAATVVSHSGIFTLEFDPTFRGARRMNDKAAGMKKQYEGFLDSLASKQVHLGKVPADRMNEIRESVANEIPGDSSEVLDARQARIKEMLNAEQKNPTPSQERVEGWKEDFIRDKAGTLTDTEGNPMEIGQVRAELSMSTGSPLDSNDDMIGALNASEQWSNYAQKREQEYRMGLSALKLNGQGYYNALVALKEKYPYFIKDVRWTPPDSDGLKMQDEGYVKRNNLRSDKIQTGYFDPKIEGMGSKPKGSKRSAGDENYANWAAKARVGTFDKRPLNADNPESEDQVNPTEGVGGLTASTSTPTSAVISPQTDGNAAYSGFTALEGGGVNLTPYQQNRKIIDLRRQLRSMGPVPVKNDVGGYTEVTPWERSEDNELLNQFPTLFDDGSDDVVVDRLASNPEYRAGLIQEINQLYDAGSNDPKTAEGAIVNKIGDKGAFIGLAASTAPQAPTTAESLINYIGSRSSNRQFNFGTKRIKGDAYLPGRTTVEYEAAWKSDPDIRTFQDTAADRFGYNIGIAQDPQKFNGLLKGFARSMDSAMGKADQWRQAINSSGGASKVTGADVVDYGGKKYSLYSVNDLESAVAKDALAIAKMKQLHGHIQNSPGNLSPESLETVSIDDVPESQFGTGGARTSPTGAGARELTEDNVRGLREEASAPKQIDRQKLKESRARIDKLTGLKDVKEQYDSLITEYNVNERRKAAGMPVRNTTQHLIFTGNPGTGKTTVAKEIGNTFNALGFLPTDNIVVASRADLVGGYAGQTAIKTRKKLDEAKGGVLFIDEAYALKNGEDDSFGQEAIDEIVYRSEEDKDDTIIILAGYNDDMGNLMKTNPGLKSRFPRVINFPDYSRNELQNISENSLKEQGYKFDPSSKRQLSSVMQKISNSPNFSNARDVRNFGDELQRAQSHRIDNEDVGEFGLDKLTASDIENAEKKYFKHRTGSVA